MSQEEKEQIDRILQSRDYYEILNVSRFGLDQDELRRNYIKVSENF
jgi:curved DNA-binding protein CbpA